MNSKLFSQIKLRELTLKNRIVISPMCQYSAIDGSATDWHLIHLGHLALSGAGLLIIEATAVNREGRITLNDLGLYSDDNEKALSRVLESIRKYADTAIGIQLNHSGRKGSAEVPWRGGGPLKPEEGAWTAYAPSPIPRDQNWPTPQEMSLPQIEALKKDYISAAQRARRLNIDLIELHMAHGYLLHEFISPISNRRTDRYGGSFENRMRLPLEIAAAVRIEWPADKPMGARITGNDWLSGGLTVEDAITFTNSLKSVGFDYVCISSGGIIPKTNMPLDKPDYQISLAEQIKKEVNLPVQAVGFITNPEQAEEIIASGKADMVTIARAFLDDPRWVWHAAQSLGVKMLYPPQYLRAHPEVWPGYSSKFKK
jgi:2,4-dienoyl-CoA reductase-like NADH-dependent reductase (Old Yellow Enzyme family)